MCCIFEAGMLKVDVWLSNRLELNLVMRHFDCRLFVSRNS